MAQSVMLKNAMKEMASGSKKAFHTFFIGTAQYVYQSAFYLYANERSAREFMVDFYQYLYLHLPEYTSDQSLERWISTLVGQRFRELSIGRQIPVATLQQRMTTVELDKETKNQIWRMLEMRISFPPEKVHFPYLLIVIILSFAMLFLLLGYHYKNTLFPATQNNLDAANLSPSASEDDEDASSDEADKETEKQSSTSDNDENANSPTADTLDEDDLTDQLTNHFQKTPEDDTQTNNSGQSESDQEQTNSSSIGEHLEDYDINLHYGDTLTNRGTLSDYE